MDLSLIFLIFNCIVSAALFAWFYFQKKHIEKQLDIHKKCYGELYTDIKQINRKMDQNQKEYIQRIVYLQLKVNEILEENKCIGELDMNIMKINMKIDENDKEYIKKIVDLQIKVYNMNEENKINSVVDKEK